MSVVLKSHAETTDSPGDSVMPPSRSTVIEFTTIVVVPVTTPVLTPARCPAASVKILRVRVASVTAFPPPTSVATGTMNVLLVLFHVPPKALYVPPPEHPHRHRTSQKHRPRSRLGHGRDGVAAELRDAEAGDALAVDDVRIVG